MDWKTFKEQVEKAGVTDSMEVEQIEVDCVDELEIALNEEEQSFSVFDS